MIYIHKSQKKLICMTFIYFLQKDPDTGEFVALIIAGGGGGKSYYMGHEPIRADGGLSPPGSGQNAFTPSDGPGT